MLVPDARAAPCSGGPRRSVGRLASCLSLPSDRCLEIKGARFTCAPGPTLDFKTSIGHPFARCVATDRAAPPEDRGCAEGGRELSRSGGEVWLGVGTGWVRPCAGKASDRGDDGGRCPSPTTLHASPALRAGPTPRDGPRARARLPNDSGPVRGRWWISRVSGFWCRRLPGRVPIRVDLCRRGELRTLYGRASPC